MIGPDPSSKRMGKTKVSETGTGQLECLATTAAGATLFDMIAGVACMGKEDIQRQAECGKYGDACCKKWYPWNQRKQYLKRRDNASSITWAQSNPEVRSILSDLQWRPYHIRMVKRSFQNYLLCDQREAKRHSFTWKQKERIGCMACVGGDLSHRNVCRLCGAGGGTDRDGMCVTQSSGRDGKHTQRRFGRKPELCASMCVRICCRDTDGNISTPFPPDWIIGRARQYISAGYPDVQNMLAITDVGGNGLH